MPTQQPCSRIHIRHWWRLAGSFRGCRQVTFEKHSYLWHRAMSTLQNFSKPSSTFYTSATVRLYDKNSENGSLSQFTLIPLACLGYSSTASSQPVALWAQSWVVYPSFCSSTTPEPISMRASSCSATLEIAEMHICFSVVQHMVLVATIPFVKPFVSVRHHCVVDKGPDKCPNRRSKKDVLLAKAYISPRNRNHFLSLIPLSKTPSNNSGLTTTCLSSIQQRCSGPCLSWLWQIGRIALGATIKAISHLCTVMSDFRYDLLGGEVFCTPNRFS